MQDILGDPLIEHCYFCARDVDIPLQVHLCFIKFTVLKLCGKEAQIDRIITFRQALQLAPVHREWRRILGSSDAGTL